MGAAWEPLYGKARLELVRTWSTSSAVGMGGEGCATAWGLAQQWMAWGGMAKVTVAVGDMLRAVKGGGEARQLHGARRVGAVSPQVWCSRVSPFEAG